MGTVDRRLLILDDEPEVGRIIGLIAEGADFEWRSTTHPDEFFRLLDTWLPTHLAVDLVMPEMDGVQVMRQLSERGCTCRIVITSGVGSRVMDAAMRSGVEHGLDVRGVVPKPFSALTLRVLLLDEPDDWPASTEGNGSQEPGCCNDSPSAELGRVIKDKKFSIVYQPKIDCATGNLSGLQVLVQLDNIGVAPELPGKLVENLDRDDLIDAFTAEVFDQSLRWFGVHFSGSNVTLAINVSAQDLLQSKFLDALIAQCQNHHVAPEQIILELAETSAMKDPTRSLDALTRFRMKGFQLSLDDFGTGYSSMVQLVRLPFSEIKVDASFVVSISSSEESRAVVKSIVELGHSLGLKVTAEGVEDAATSELLAALGCDLLQGAHVSPVMSGEAVLQWLASRN
jgi:EAL domain-containing protein (putative c-di-GMP-specific phosphodiesterase class I)